MAQDKTIAQLAVLSSASLTAATRFPVYASGTKGANADVVLGGLARLAGVHVATDPLYGATADGSTDARAALAAGSAGAVAAGAAMLLPSGTYLVGSALTIAAPLTVVPGAVLRPASGVTITISGAGHSFPGCQWIDTSLGGAVVFAEKAGAVLDPRWWGAKGDWNQDAQTGTDDADAFQAMASAIAAAGTAWNGATVDLGVGKFYLTEGFTVAAHNIHLRGRGQHATQLVFDPASDGAVCVTFNKGSSAELFGGSMSGVGFISTVNGSGVPDSAYQKIAMDFVDTSEVHLSDVAVHNSWHTSGRSATAPSIGMKFRGREAFYLRNVTIAADRPVQVSNNPSHNGGVGSYDLDTIECQNLYLQTQEDTESAFLIDSGVYVQNFVIGGSQVWTGGTNGIKWVNAPGGSASCRSVEISNLRFESTGATVTSGHLIDIRHDLSQLLTLAIRNVQPAFTQAIRLRGCNHVSLENITFSGASGKVPLDIDQCQHVYGRNVHVQVGNSVRFGGSTSALYAAAHNITVSATASVGATSLSVNALSGDVPENTILVFTSPTRYARVTAAASTGATSLAVEALTASIASAQVATYEGMKQVYALGDTSAQAIEPDFYWVKATNTSAVLKMPNLPTGSGGLPTGALYNDAGTVKVA